ncbi:transmembrane protein [Perilla frutescens var. hirtella]|uniref:Transmembrane protein n=1 Tax=Perilla frutescens var. hirtella TaxID=608512 RepID=A0AAD4J2G4_PERFH|nr:transmembrane protein [Perilla frutescens var. hirtella]
MTGTDNAQVECSGNKVEEEDSSRTANCLRGRLLAERLASRNAREEAEHLGIRVLEVERLLKQEAKSRKRAEKKLKILMKRLECMNISYVADESEESFSSDKTTDVSSVSSTASWKPEKIKISAKEIVLSVEEINDSQLSLWSPGPSPSQDSSNSTATAVEPESEKPVHRMESSGDREGLNGEEQVDNLTALVPVDMPLPAEDERQSVDPEVLDETVKQVLESLRRAKEQLQSSMEERRRRRMSINMIKVG